jgi:hypothetical protein
MWGRGGLRRGHSILAVILGIGKKLQVKSTKHKRQNKHEGHEEEGIRNLEIQHAINSTAQTTK